MAKRISKWFSEQQHTYTIKPTYPKLIKHNGRKFHITEYSYLNFANLGGTRDFMSRTYYRIEEVAVFDHLAHNKRLAEDLRSRAACESYIAKLGPLNSEQEARNARSERIRWLRDEAIPRQERKVKGFATRANRKYTPANPQRKRPRKLKTPETVEFQRASFVNSRSALQQLKTDLRRALKLQAT